MTPPPARLPKAIWALGFTSLFMDASSELIHALLPIYLTTTLGVSVMLLGLLEGMSEAIAQVSKVYSGWLSDRLGHRKWLTVAGYALAAASKPIFPLAESVNWVFAARAMDRLGKGLRGAPRDALIADLTVPEQRGAAYGLRQTLDSVGAVIGPSAAIVLVVALAVDVRTALWAATVPAVLAVLVLVFGVQEPTAASIVAPRAVPLHWSDIRMLPRRFWGIAALGAVFTLARFSEAFLILRGSALGLSIGWAPLVLIVMNGVYAASAYPAGRASDRLGSRGLLLLGMFTLLAADLCLAFAESGAAVWGGAALWGLHLGLTQGLFSRLIADVAPTAARGTAFGLFSLVSGVVLLAASSLAGLLWVRFGAATTFLAGAALAAIAMVGLALRGRA